jgi:CHAT domain-containing protein
MTRSHRFQIFALTMGMELAACTKSPSDLRRLVPQLSEDMARHLSEDSKASFRQYARKAGLNGITVAYFQVLTAPPTESAGEFEQTEDRLAPHLERLVDVLSEDFRMPAVRNRQGAYAHYPPLDRRKIVRLIRTQRVLALEDTRSIQEKAPACRALIEECRPYADAIDVASLCGAYAGYLSALNQRDLMPHYLNVGIEAAMQCKDLDMASQLLGTLGVWFAGRGDYEQMRASWNRGIELAREARSWQESRLLGFYASFYLHRGRFALCRDLMRRAQDRCRELGETRMEIRFLVEGVQLLSNLECWPVVAGDLQRADMLLHEGEKDWGPGERDHWFIRLQRCRAMYLSAMGFCADADSVASEIIRKTATWEPSPIGVAAHMDAILSLRRCGNLKEALRLLDDENELAHVHGFPETQEEWDLQAGEIRFLLGDIDGSRMRLNAYRKERVSGPPDQLDPEWLRGDVLDVRLALATRDLVAARQALAVARQDLSQQMDRLDSSPDAGLALPVASEINGLAHEILDTSAEVGYAREMACRMEQVRGLHSRAPKTNVELVDWARKALERLSRDNAVHCVYRIESDRIVRWTAFQNKVTRDEVLVRPRDLEDHVGAVRRTLFSSGLDDSLVAESRGLATMLLPQCLSTGNSPRRVLITAEGSLLQLPFEILNVSQTSYEPLLDRCDVAMVLFDRLKQDLPAEPGLVVSDPAYSADFKRQYSILTESLPLGAKEAKEAAQFLGGATLIRGSEATKARLLESWKKAGILYFACHAIQDPDLPSAAFIPLAASAGSNFEDAYLDIVDVRGADLSRCGLVVLSNCRSGVSYTSGHLAAASLAQSFVEAGARAVISTSWNVNDEDAAQLMHAFAAGYGPAGRDPVRALNQARRQFMKAGALPKMWASYSITLGEI